MYSRLLSLSSPIESALEGHKRLIDQWSDVAFVLTRLLKLITRRLSHYSGTGSLPSGVRAQQIRTLSGIVYSFGVFVILFLTMMSILDTVNVNIKPLLASAGIVGLAIGFGAQTLVKDVVTGFFV